MSWAALIKLLWPVFLGAAVLGVGFWAGQRYQALQDAPVISSLKTDVATAQKALSDYRTQVEADRADANAKALAEKAAQEAQEADLRAKLAQTTQDRNRASAALVKALNDAQASAHALSPGVAAYLASLRQQAAPAATAGN